MEELIEARRPFPVAYDTLYRRERLLRYVYWLAHGAKPAFNFIGTWIPAEMRAELAMWRSMRARDFDDIDIIDTVTEDLERRFGLDLADATLLAANPELARLHLPIWNNAADCLVPQVLGDFRIIGMDDYQQRWAGHSYTFQHPTADARATLFLYDLGFAQIEPGIRDQRMPSALWGSIQDIEQAAKIRGGTIQRLTEVFVHVIRSPADVEIPFVNTVWEHLRADGSQVIEEVSMTGFRDMFLKIRFTCPKIFFETDACQGAADAFNPDLADFVAQFGSPKPQEQSCSNEPPPGDTRGATRLLS